jgi:hypothetical protein
MKPECAFQKNLDTDPKPATNEGMCRGTFFTRSWYVCDKFYGGLCAEKEDGGVESSRVESITVSPVATTLYNM